VAQNNLELQAGLVALRAEVVQAVQDLYTAAANTRAIAQDQLQLTEQVRDAITKAYEAGGRPLLDMLDAQRNYRDTYRLFISSRASYGRAFVKVNAAMGQQIAP
jgi:cobalt-zinc-cadmium efflux system outer membrane protein